MTVSLKLEFFALLCNKNFFELVSVKHMVLLVFSGNVQLHLLK